MSTPARTMVTEQLEPHGVTDERVLRVMESVPREEFVPEWQRRHAYEDRALAIGCGQTISQPLIVALMTQAVNPQPGDVALEIGAGSGYQAAVLSRLCKRVITMEREPVLAAGAAATLSRLGYDNVEVEHGDGSLGWPASAPYDIVLVACAAADLPPALVDELADGGRLVIPIAVTSEGPQDLRLYRRLGTSVGYESLFPVLFVPLRPGEI